MSLRRLIYRGGNYILFVEMLRRDSIENCADVVRHACHMRCGK
jgi:hypothetical protein